MDSSISDHEEIKCALLLSPWLSTIWTSYASLKPGCCLLTSLSSVLLFHLLIPSIMSPDQRLLEGMGGGGGLICSRALSNVRVVPNHMDVSSFEFLEITFSFHLQNIRMAILYHPGHPGTDHAFMEEFGQFLEILSVCREKLVMCGDFNFWLDNPSLKPYANEFMSLLDINNISNYVQMPTHLWSHSRPSINTSRC